MPGKLAEAPVTVFASAARTATSTSSVFTLPGGLTASGRGSATGLLVIIDCTALALTPSVTFALETSSGPADAFAAVLTSTAVTTADTTTLMVVHPDAPNNRANLVDQGPLESLWRITATHADTDSITYSVTAVYLR